MKVNIQVIYFALMAILVSCKISDVKEKQAARILPFYTTAEFTPQWIDKSAREYSNIHTIPDFTFINQQGDTITEKTFLGKIYVANFFFTTCPGICKKLTTNLGLVQNAFEKDTTLLLLSHSVTPEKDNSQRLKEYANEHGVLSNKWHLVTGNREKIYFIARNAYFADEDMGEKKTKDDFLHTENVLLIDKHRRIRGVYKGTSVQEMNNLISDITLLKREE